VTDTQTPTAKRRRWRFQFSLRTLMIAVLAYGFLWVVTIKWGGAMLARDYAAHYKSSSVRFEGDGTAISVKDEIF